MALKIETVDFAWSAQTAKPLQDACPAAPGSDSAMACC